MIRAVIVDDEPNACNVLQLILENYCNDVEVVGMAETFDAAHEMIKDLCPDLVFLDIAMPTGSGLDLAKLSAVRRCRVVLVSGHLEHGVEAYQCNAVYYIAKPVAFKEVQKAVDICRESLLVEAVYRQHDPQKTHTSGDGRFLVHEKDGTRLIPYEKIQYIKGFDGYSKVFLQGEKPITISKPIKEVEAMLPWPRFLRTHRSFITNSAFIAKVGRSRHGNIELWDGTSTPLGKEYLEEIRRYLLGMN